jgi:hypothetical protein
MLLRCDYFCEDIANLHKNYYNTDFRGKTLGIVFILAKIG